MNKSSDQIAILGELGFNNIRDIQALQRLAGEKGIGILTEAIQRSNTAWSENTALQTEFDKKAATTASKIQLMKNNLVEAGRSIGETFLPDIANATTGIKEFAQHIANMDDSAKERLIGIGKAVIGIGAGAKILSGGAKFVGGTIESIGKIGDGVSKIKALTTATTAAGTALTGAGAAGTVAAGGIGAIASTAGIAVAGIVALTAAAYGGYKIYQAWYKANYQWSEGLSKADTAIDKSLSKYKEINAIQSQVKDLKMVINSPDSSKEQVDNAKSKLEEIRKLLSEEYNLVIKSDNSNIESAVKELTKLQRTQLERDINSGLADLAEKRGKFQSFESDYKTEEKSYNSAKSQFDTYNKLSGIMQDLRRQEEQGIITHKEYGNKLREAVKGTDIYTRDITSIEGNINSYLKYWAHQQESLGGNLKVLQAARDEYAAISESMANKELELLNTDALDQNTAGVTKRMEELKSLIQGADLDASGYAQAAALTQTSMSTMAQAWEAGGDTLDYVVTKYIQAGQQFEVPAGEIIKNAAFMRSGFSDMDTALRTDNGLKTVADNMTMLGRAMGEIDGEHHIEISAGGDVQLVETATRKVEEIDGKNVDVKVNAVEVITETGTKVIDLDGQTASVKVNAEGNYEVVNEAGEALATINGQTGVINVVAGDTSGMQVAQEYQRLGDKGNSSVTVGVKANTDSAEAAIGGLNNQNVTVPVSANVSSAQQAIAGLNGTTVTVNVKANKIGFARGTMNAPEGLSVINDQRGVSDPRELVEHDGKHYIFEGRDVVVPLSKGDKVYTAAQTKAILPHYASGKNNEAWDGAKSDRDHYRKTTYHIIPAAEELQWLEDMKQRFKDDAEVIKEIEEEIVSYTKQMWQESLEAEQFALDMGWQSEEDYYSKLAVYRDANFAPDTEEWKEATLELKKYSEQLVKNANDVSKAWLETRAALNDWDEIGDSMGAAYNRINERNKQAVLDGNLTWEEYLETANETFSDVLNGYIDYSGEWIDAQKKYNAMSADDTIAAIDRQKAEVEAFFAEIGELTDEQYAVKIQILAELDQSSMEASADRISEWESEADLYKRQSDTYGWDWLHDDSEADFQQRRIDKYMEFYNDESLSLTDRNAALRKADEARLDLYKAQEKEYDDILDMAKDRMDETEKLLNDKLSALDESWKVEDRAESKAETLADIEKYKNAVTIEGKEKYQEALDKLKEIEREEQRYALEQENNAIMTQLQADYDRLEAEKKNILEQTRLANQNIAQLLTPLESDITNSMDTLAGRIEKAIKDIKPSVTVNQTNNITTEDNTDVKLFTNKVLEQIIEGVNK